MKIGPIADIRVNVPYDAEMAPPVVRYPMPSLARIVAGLFLGGSLPGGLVGLLALSGGSVSNALGFGAFLGVFYGAAPALVLGLPAIYVLRDVVRPSIKACLLAGIIVASLPVVAVGLTVGPGLLALLLASAPLGAIGGATFWLVALRGLKPLNEHTSPPGFPE